MIVLILYINLLNLALITKCLFLRNMEPLTMELHGTLSICIPVVFAVHGSRQLTPHLIGQYIYHRFGVI